MQAVANLVAGQLRTLGLAVELRPSARFGPHLLFSSGPANGAPVFLLGHTDTVFAPGTFEGFRREGGRAVGPGAFDMKGGIAVMLFGLVAAKRAGLLERVPVKGILVADEEVGSPESQGIIRTHATGAACALGFESGRPGDLLITRRKGVGSLHAEARGIAAHAGNEHDKGRNAIWSIARFIDRAQALTDYERGRTVNVGLVSGGTTKNTVPAGARCEVDLRFETVEDGRALGEAVEALAADAAVPGTTLAISRGAWRDPLERTQASSALAKEYGDCQRESGLGQGEAPLVGRWLRRVHHRRDRHPLHRRARSAREGLPHPGRGGRPLDARAEGDRVPALSRPARGLTPRVNAPAVGAADAPSVAGRVPNASSAALRRQRSSSSRWRRARDSSAARSNPRRRASRRCTRASAAKSPRRDSVPAMSPSSSHTRESGE